FSKILDSFSSRSDFFYTLKCEEPLYATNQPRGRGVGAVTRFAGCGTPLVNGLVAENRKLSRPLTQGQPTSIQ
ncbi:MAG: hypothetical protein K2X58_11720, partial [Pseudomonadaceae bacterium]|nr:hypothetical protein [Pseudomonadaceae bacterium]